MRKILFRTGLVLVLVGVILMLFSLSRFATPVAVTIVESTPPHTPIETHLESGAYQIYIFGFSVHPPDDAKIMVYDQNNLTVFESSVYETIPNGTLKFGYDFTVQKPQNYSIALYDFNVGYFRLTATKYVYNPALTYVSLFYIGLTMVIAGVALIIYDHKRASGNSPRSL
jgi:hypothetical protein